MQMGGQSHLLYSLGVLLPKSCTTVDGVCSSKRSRPGKLPGPKLPLYLLVLILVDFRGTAGSGAASSFLGRWLPSCWRLPPPLTSSLPGSSGFTWSSTCSYWSSWPPYSWPEPRCCRCGWDCLDGLVGSSRHA